MTPIKGKLIGYIDVTETMHFTMDVRVHSIPSTGFRNVFQVDDDPGIPAIHIHGSAGETDAYYQGFWILYPEGDGVKSTGAAVGNALENRKSYRIKIDFTQSWIRIQIDGRTLLDTPKEPHATRLNVPVYVSSPSNAYLAADVSVSNLLISSDVPCYLNGSPGCSVDSICDADTGTCSDAVVVVNQCATSVATFNHSLHDLLLSIQQSIDDFLDDQRDSSAHIVRDVQSSPFDAMDGLGAVAETPGALMTPKDLIMIGLLILNMMATISVGIFVLKWKRQSEFKHEPVESISLALPSEAENLRDR